MNVTYIHHSGFLIETEACYYLIDYFQGSIPALNPCKLVLVLASHKHHDHYQRGVFSTLKDMGMQQIYAVLSRDIPSGARPEDMPCLLVSAGKRYELPQGQTLLTFRSTDLGVAFLIRDGKALFYHAGDLNDWVWAEEPEADNQRMTEKYQEQIDLLAPEPIMRKIVSCGRLLTFSRQLPRRQQPCCRVLMFQNRSRFPIRGIC